MAKDVLRPVRRRPREGGRLGEGGHYAEQGITPRRAV